MPSTSNEASPLLPATASHIKTAEQNETECTGSRPGQEKVSKLLESTRFHLIVLLLIAIDAIFVLIDLGWDVLKKDQCVKGHVKEDPQWLEILSHLSLAITTFFIIEIPLAMYGFGLGYYNPFGKMVHSGLHFIDACVIVGTFVLEVFLRGAEKQLASLLILARLWRLVKLVGGVAVGVGETSEGDIKDLDHARALLNDKDVKIRSLEAELTRLRDAASVNPSDI